jgi:hypothetical protein
MCDKSRQTHNLLQKLISLLDIETAAHAYHGDIAKAKATAELASVCHDALIKYSQAICKAEAEARIKLNQQPWVPDDIFDNVH